MIMILSFYHYYDIILIAQGLDASVCFAITSCTDVKALKLLKVRIWQFKQRPCSSILKRSTLCALKCIFPPHTSCIFHIVCQEVLYCPVVQGHYKWGRESAEVSKWDRWGLEGSPPFHKCWFWGDYAAGWSTKEIPPQSHEGIAVTFKFSGVNINALWMTALNCYAVWFAHLFY